MGTQSARHTLGHVGRYEEEEDALKRWQMDADIAQLWNLSNQLMLQMPFRAPSQCLRELVLLLCECSGLSTTLVKLLSHWRRKDCVIP